MKTPLRAGAPRATRIGSRLFSWGSRTFIMGVVNVTPDSFSGDGVGLDPAAALRRALDLEAAGADLIDLGGESTRPGHEPVGVADELARVLPALRAIVGALGIPVSIDTSKAAVARAAVDAGAALVNDVSGLCGDPGMAETIRILGVPAVVMARGASRVAGVMARVRADLDASLAVATAAGLDRDLLIVDPGFGFGKTWRDNLELLRRLGELRSYELPLLAGFSRKATIARVLGSERRFRVSANSSLAALAVSAGVDMVRLHDVEQVGAAVRLADAVVRGVDAALDRTQ